MTHTEIAPRMSLRALLAGVAAGEIPEVEVCDLSLDSRNVRAGGAFVALRGTRTHGLDYVHEALAAGARAVLWEPAPGIGAPDLPSHVTALAVEGLSVLVGHIASRFFCEPSESIDVTAVTGTNGKTTCAYLLAAAVAQLGRESAYLGTLGFGPTDALEPGTHTTPDAITVQRCLAHARARGVRHLSLEVSSHALDQHRIGGTRLHTALFTNLTHDHLDYHGTFEAYGAAKARLFDWPRLRHAVINVDDAFGRTLAFERHHDAFVTAVSARARPKVSALRMRALYAERVTALPSGLQINVNGSWGAGLMHSRLIGGFNVENVLGVLGVLLGHDIPLDRAIAALERCTPPPGRMETFSAPGMPLAVVDYAHTPDALEKALGILRRHCSGRLVCVFGCGGDRDPTKRPLMGAIAERLADRVFVTDDNPRTEDGDAIVADILNGMKAADRVSIVRDRAQAIERAIREASPQDAVLIAGKGHEDYQLVGQVKRAFSDRDLVKAIFRRRV